LSYTISMDATSKKLALSDIMGKVHALAETAWPRDACGVSKMPEAGERAIMDIQTAAEKALGLPALDLMTGDTLFDIT